MSIHAKQIEKMFKSVNPQGHYMSKQAKVYVALLLDKVLLVFLEQCSSLMHPKNIGGKALSSEQDISNETVKAAVRLCLPRILQKYALREIDRANQKTILSITTLKTKTEEYLHCKVDDPVALSITVLLEYILAEIAELSGNVTDRRETNVKDVKVAIENDDELKLLLQCIM